MLVIGHETGQNSMGSGKRGISTSSALLLHVRDRFFRSAGNSCLHKLTWSPILFYQFRITAGIIIDMTINYTGTKGI